MSSDQSNSRLCHSMHAAVESSKQLVEVADAMKEAMGLNCWQFADEDHRKVCQFVLHVVEVLAADKSLKAEDCEIVNDSKSTSSSSALCLRTALMSKINQHFEVCYEEAVGDEEPVRHKLNGAPAASWILNWAKEICGYWERNEDRRDVLFPFDMRMQEI